MKCPKWINKWKAAGRSGSISNISESRELEVEAELAKELSRKEIDKRVVKRAELLLPL